MFKLSNKDELQNLKDNYMIIFILYQFLPIWRQWMRIGGFDTD
jgi:hypothetical protein